MPQDLSKELKFGLEVVRKACFLAESVRKKFQSASVSKADKSPVTIGDYAIQALIGAFLQKQFSKDILIGEERASSLRESSHGALLGDIRDSLKDFLGQVATDEQILSWVGEGGLPAGNRAWVLDPIDGTKGFIRGGQYAVSLALLENGVVTLGILGCPKLQDDQFPEPGILAWAVRGQGAWHSDLSENAKKIPLKVSDCNSLGEARMVCSEDESHTDLPRILKVLEAAGNQKKPFEMSSLAKIVVLANGRTDFLLRLPSPKSPDYREWIWDQAAGSLILEEAGGMITDMTGKALNFHKGLRLFDNIGIVASNKKVHTELLKLLKQIRSGA